MHQLKAVQQTCCDVLQAAPWSLQDRSKASVASIPHPLYVKMLAWCQECCK